MHTDHTVRPLPLSRGGHRPYYRAGLVLSLLAISLIALAVPGTGAAQSTAGVIVYGGVDHNLSTARLVGHDYFHCRKCTDCRPGRCRHSLGSVTLPQSLARYRR